MRKKRRVWLLVLLWIALALFAFYQRGGLTAFSVTSKEDVLTLAQSLLRMEPPAVVELRSVVYPDEEEGKVEYYYQLLGSEEKKAYRQMLASFRNWEEEFFLTIAEDEEIDRVYHAVLNDHPEVFWVRNRKPVFKTLYGGRTYSSFTPAYSYKEEADLIEEMMEEALLDLRSSIWEGATDYEKAFEAYVWLIDHADYMESEDDQSAAGVFWKGEAVCAGYAAAYQYLLEGLGVYCIYVEGENVLTGEGHAWNVIRLDGDYYYVDTTNGDQPEFLSGDAASLEEHKTILMDYLCPFPWEYEKVYVPMDMFDIPACEETDMNFYVRNNGCMDYYEEEALDEYFHMRIDNGAAVIRFKFSSQNAFEEAYENWGNSMGLEDAIQYYMQVNGLMQVKYHYGMLENFYTMYYIF